MVMALTVVIGFKLHSISLTYMHLLLGIVGTIS